MCSYPFPFLSTENEQPADYDRRCHLLTYVDTDMYRMRDAEAVRSRQDSLDCHFISYLPRIQRHFQPQRQG